MVDKERERELEQLAGLFLEAWKRYQAARGEQSESFQRHPLCQTLIGNDLIADHNPRIGEYAIQHKYTGCIFFTGNGELAFTRKGLPFAKKVCDLYRRQGSRDMQVIKVEY